MHEAEMVAQMYEKDRKKGRRPVISNNYVTMNMSCRVYPMIGVT